VLRLEGFVVEVAVAARKLEGAVLRLEVVREGDAAGADRRELGTAFSDEGVVVVHGPSRSRKIVGVEVDASRRPSWEGDT
jgi:hypothetical protein